jgi:hypothetical protein
LRTLRQTKKTPKVVVIAMARAIHGTDGLRYVLDLYWFGSGDVVKLHHDGVSATTAETL